MTPRLEVRPDAGSLAERAAQWLLRVIGEEAGPAAVALAGGSTPRLLYARLTEPPYRDAFPWARIHWFWGDERCVPPDDPASNYRMVRETLLSRVPIGDANVHRIPAAGVPPDEAARAYESTLRAFHAGAGDADPHRPLFAATLLGLGEDGHTASLFPGAPALTEGERWVVATRGRDGDPRITLTYAALGRSRHVAFLVTGRAKRAALARVLAHDETLPAARVRALGTLTWFADEAAARGVRTRRDPSRPEP